MISDISFHDRDRAQLILIGSIAIAFIIIGLVVVFNTVLYTNNLSSQGATDEVGDMGEFKQQVMDETPELAQRVAYSVNSSDHDELHSRVGENVSAYSELVAESYADTGPQYVSVDFESENTTNATRVIHKNESQNFSSSEGVIVTDRELKDFRMNLTVDELSGPGSDNFTMLLEGGSGSVVELDIGHDGTGDTIVVNQTGVGENECRVSTSEAHINVTNGNISDCSFNSIDELDGPYDIDFQNGGDAKGRYTFMVTGERPSTVNQVGDGSPYSVALIWEIGLEVQFESSNLNYHGHLTVEAPATTGDQKSAGVI